jgi:hypothetical protein
MSDTVRRTVGGPVRRTVSNRCEPRNRPVRVLSVRSEPGISSVFVQPTLGTTIPSLTRCAAVSYCFTAGNGTSSVRCPLILVKNYPFCIYYCLFLQPLSVFTVKVQITAKQDYSQKHLQLQHFQALATIENSVFINKFNSHHIVDWRLMLHNSEIS